MDNLLRLMAILAVIAMAWTADAAKPAPGKSLDRTDWTFFHGWSESPEAAELYAALKLKPMADGSKMVGGVLGGLNPEVAFALICHAPQKKKNQLLGSCDLSSLIRETGVVSQRGEFSIRLSPSMSQHLFQAIDDRHLKGKRKKLANVDCRKLSEKNFSCTLNKMTGVKSPGTDGFHNATDAKVSSLIKRLGFTL